MRSHSEAESMECEMREGVAALIAAQADVEAASVASVAIGEEMLSIEIALATRLGLSHETTRAALADPVRWAALVAAHEAGGGS